MCSDVRWRDHIRLNKYESFRVLCVDWADCGLDFVFKMRFTFVRKGLCKQYHTVKFFSSLQYSG